MLYSMRTCKGTGATPFCAVRSSDSTVAVNVSVTKQRNYLNQDLHPFPAILFLGSSQRA